MPAFMMACMVVILMPLPAAVMDLLLAGNVALAVVILLTAIHVKSPLEFSVFPTALLVTTLSRLVLNIATTRMILTNAPTQGEDAAGGVIRTFGQFVAGNQVEVGLIIFLILVIVQFVVITKGATRISEVAARFALDGMPGRQSAIEADVNAGAIDSDEAARRRQELVSEADFYSAMDGAGKFVRGDAIAGLVITAINIIGGLYLGIIVSDMRIGQAASVFTKLTIGDGLVSQLPSLLISLAAGILVTRGTRATNLPDRFVGQMLGNSTAIAISGVFVLLLTVTGLPIVPLLLLGGGLLFIAWTLSVNQREAEKEQAIARETEQATASANQKRVEDFLNVDPLEVAIGLGLLPLADPARGGDLMQRISALRNQMAAEIGIVLPKVRVRDDATLGELEYEIRLFGDFVARGQLRTDKLLAVANGKVTGKLEGETAEGFGAQSAVWIPSQQREQAMIYGYKTLTAPVVLTNQLEQVARVYADELLSHDATGHLLDELKQIAPVLVNELIPQRMTTADVQKVLQGLLRESIPIRQLGIILEAIGEATSRSMETLEQIEFVRQRLARTLCVPLRDELGVLHAIAFDKPTQSMLIKTTNDQSTNDSSSSVRRQSESDFNKSKDVTCDAIRQGVKTLIDQGHPPVVVVAPAIRRRVKSMLEASGIWAHVLSTNEITDDTQVNLTAISIQPSEQTKHVQAAGHAA
ncbi:flagellar biosynthesis protein FlhA [Stieleria sp. JC731]|uniref:flagellar biosynthesis protein FlhA n=1 Tax=Pirellulaceae TaxID=2691357 RepID=UPI001E65068A|nr:flagellar biosynthesis protein FlhA [Stieleria sp. JC731]MCC9599757.1 flagellar biosynthesis protein FlhA [Stieleria sp. JC731]